MLQTQDISWAYDREHLYGNYQAQNFNDQPQYRGGGTITQNVSQAENLLVWMKPAAYHTFRKLYGRIDQPLLAGGPGHGFCVLVLTVYRAVLGSYSLLIPGPEAGLCHALIASERDPLPAGGRQLSCKALINSYIKQLLPALATKLVALLCLAGGAVPC